MKIQNNFYFCKVYGETFTKTIFFGCNSETNLLLKRVFFVKTSFMIKQRNENFFYLFWK